MFILKPFTYRVLLFMLTITMFSFADYTPSDSEFATISANGSKSSIRNGRQVYGNGEMEWVGIPEILDGLKFSTVDIKENSPQKVIVKSPGKVWVICRSQDAEAMSKDGWNTIGTLRCSEEQVKWRLIEKVFSAKLSFELKGVTHTRPFLIYP